MSYLFFYSLLIYAYKATRSDILITCYRAAWNTLRVLNSFKLVLIILVNLAYFSDTIFFTFLRIFSCYINSCGWRFIYLSPSLFLYISSLLVDFYILLIALFIFFFTRLLATFAALYNTVTFIYRFRGAIIISLSRAILGQHLYSPVLRRR